MPNKKFDHDKQEQYAQQKRLFQDEGFGDVYTFVKEVLITLSKNPYLMMKIVEKCENSQNNSSLSSLLRCVAQSMYDNIVDDNIFSKDILKILIFCFKKLTPEKKHYFELNFQEDSIYTQVLRQVLERNEIKQYSKQIIKNTLLEIAKVDHPLDFKEPPEDERLNQSQYLFKMKHKESQNAREQSPIKAARQSTGSIDKHSRVSLYSQALKIQD